MAGCRDDGVLVDLGRRSMPISETWPYSNVPLTRKVMIVNSTRATTTPSSQPTSIRKLHPAGPWSMERMTL